MTYALIIHPRIGNDRVESFDTPERMSSAHAAYGACDIKVTATIDGEPCYSNMDMNGMRTYYLA